MTPTHSIIAAVARVRPSERHAARIVAEDAFFKALRSPAMDDAHHPEIARERAGEAAAAEVISRFA